MLYEIVHILDKDLSMFYWLKSMFYLQRSTNEIISVERLIESDNRYGEKCIKSLAIALRDIEVLKLADINDGLKWDKFEVNYDKLESLTFELEGIIKYLKEIKEKKVDLKYKLIAKIPEPRTDFTSYTSLSKKVGSLYNEVLSIISTARKEIIILNPFFNDEGISMLFNELFIKLNQNIVISIITRCSTEKDEGNRNSLKNFINKVEAANGKLKNINIYEYDFKHENYKSSTFHAKAIIIDKGEKAYIGSANITGWGLDEQLEIGTLLEDQNGLVLYNIIMYLIKEGIIREIRL